MNRRKAVKKVVSLLIITTILVAVLIPVGYFVTLSFLSDYEAYSFPQPFIPKTEFELKVELTDQGLYAIYLKNFDDQYELVMETNKTYKIKNYLKKTLSIEKTEEEIERDFSQATVDNPVYLTYDKNMFYNYKAFFSVTNKAEEALVNSLKAAGWTILISLSIGSLAGYSMARYVFAFKSQISVSLLIVRMFPTLTIAIPMAITLIKFGFFDTMFGLALVYSIPNIALTAWVTSSIFIGISKELEEASEVFGATKLQTFRYITLPLAFPGLVASSMYAFLTAWNDSINALILTNDNPTLSLVVYKNLAAGGQHQINAAGSIILIIPALIFTYFIKNYINQMWGEVKL